MKRLFGVLVLTLSVCPASASPLEPKPDARPAALPVESQSTYLHFPHTATRNGGAFLSPADAQQNFASLQGLEPPEEPTNPAFAWARHPLAEAPSLPRGKLQPGRRALVVPQADAPYPPAACTRLRSSWPDAFESGACDRTTAEPALDVQTLMSTTSPRSPSSRRRLCRACRRGTRADSMSEARRCGREKAGSTAETDVAARPHRRWTGWWQIPVLGMAYANLDIALGNGGALSFCAASNEAVLTPLAVNELVIKDLLDKNAGEGYMIDKYIDDQSTVLSSLGSGRRR